MNDHNLTLMQLVLTTMRALRITTSIIWKRSKVYFLFKTIMALTVSIIIYAQMILVKYVLDSIVEKSSYKNALVAILLYVVFHIIQNIAYSGMEIHTNLVQSDVQNELQNSIIKKVFELDLSLFDDPERLDRMNLAIEYANTGGIAVIVALFQIITYITNLVAAVFIVSSLSIAVLGIIILFIIIDYILNKKRDSMNLKFRSQITRLIRKKDYAISLVSSKTAVREVKTYNASSFVLSKFSKTYKDYRSRLKTLSLKIAALRLPVRMSDVFVQSALYIFIGHDLFTKKISVGDFSIIYTAGLALQTAITLLTEYFSEMRNMGFNASKYIEFIDQPISKSKIDTKALESNKSISIEFEDVWFRYNEFQDWVLKGVTFKLNYGEKLYIVGENGAGKTTLINVMLGLYKPQRGRVLLNGIDIDRAEDYHSSLATVFQDSHLFSYSLAENVSFIEASESTVDDIIRAMINADIFDVVKQTVNGIETFATRVFDENGVELSGGQKQKLSIARAFFRDASLFVFDEPSSSLDPVSEDKFFTTLERLSTGKSTVVVTHHLANAKTADRIILLSNGEIYENGTHLELMANQESYYEMYSLQKNMFS